MKKDMVNILERRALAFIIDVLIIIFVSMLIFYFYSVYLFSLDKGITQLVWVIYVISFFSISLKDVSGASLGKKILKLKVTPTKPNCSFITLRRIARNITTIIWPIEAVSIVVSGKRISDRLLGLNVVMYDKSSLEQKVYDDV